MGPTRSPSDGPLAEATREVLSWLSRAGATATLTPPVDAPVPDEGSGELHVWPIELLPDQGMRMSNRPDALRLRIRFLIASAGLAGALDPVLAAAAVDSAVSLVFEPIPVETWLALRVRPRTALVVEMPIRVGRPVAATPLVRGPIRVEGVPMVALHGTVLGPGNVPVPGVRVRAVDVGGSTHTDGDGRFTLPGLPAVGTTRLSVSGKGLHLSTDVVVASAQHLVLHCDFEEV
jgi:hypothetical protein